MRAALLVYLLLSVALVGVTASDPQPDSNATVDKNETGLLSKAELFAEVIDEDRREYDTSLYYVAANDTWYRADTNGTVGQRAPDGNTVPNLDETLDNGTTVDETVDLTTDDRPLYVWKVSEECSTTVYDAANGRVVFDFQIPGCRALETGSRAPNGTEHGSGDSTMAETDRDASGTTDTSETTSGRGPGFGVAGTLIVLVGITVYLTRPE